MSVHEFLLNDKFVEFSSKVAALHEKKKELTAEFKKIHEKWKADIAGIETEVTDLHNEFENWKVSLHDVKTVPTDSKKPLPKP